MRNWRSGWKCKKLGCFNIIEQEQANEFYENGLNTKLNQDQNAKSRNVKVPFGFKHTSHLTCFIELIKDYLR